MCKGIVIIHVYFCARYYHTWEGLTTKNCHQIFFCTRTTTFISPSTQASAQFSSTTLTHVPNPIRPRLPILCVCVYVHGCARAFPSSHFSRTKGPPSKSCQPTAAHVTLLSLSLARFILYTSPITHTWNPPSYWGHSHTCH